MIDLREHLAQDLLNCSYSTLSNRKKSVIDLIADQKPTGLGPLGHLDDRDRWQKLADNVAKVGGSWNFIIGFGAALLLWVGANLLLGSSNAFDPYPFIFLNLILSMLAAVQAPIIMMSQNRQAAVDRAAAEHDYVVNLRAELEIMLLHDKLDALREGDLLARADAIDAKLSKLVDDVGRLGGKN
ncbi:MAG: DUF1003 domain-containing protein [Hyphomonadaceae bacterium]